MFHEKLKHPWVCPFVYSIWITNPLRSWKIWPRKSDQAKNFDFIWTCRPLTHFATFPATLSLKWDNQSAIRHVIGSCPPGSSNCRVWWPVAFYDHTVCFCHDNHTTIYYRSQNSHFQCYRALLLYVDRLGLLTPVLNQICTCPWTIPTN